jgi:putative hydrolase of the HAD superfamily
MLKAVIFDIDDTLMDHSSAIKQAAFDFYQTVKISEVTADQFYEIWSQEHDRFLQKYLDKEITFKQQRILRVQGVFQRLGRNVDEAEAIELFRFYLKAYEKQWQLLPDAARCLAGLGGCRLGVISNGDSEQQRKKLKHIGVLDRFESIVISGDFGVSKPDPRIFSQSLEQLGTFEALFTGDDYERDFLGTAKAGLHACWLNRAYDKAFESIEGGFVINSLDLLGKVIQLINNKV